jgi:hypothetical protein
MQGCRPNWLTPILLTLRNPSQSNWTRKSCKELHITAQPDFMPFRRCCGNRANWLAFSKSRGREFGITLAIACIKINYIYLIDFMA